MQFSDPESTAVLLYSYNQGSQLSKNERMTIETALETGRATLLQKISLLGCLRVSSDENSLTKFSALLAELIKTSANLEILAQITFDRNDDHYKSISALWLDALERNPENAAIIFNAAKFHQLFDEQISEKLFSRGLSVDPTNQLKWLTALAQLYTEQSYRSGPRSNECVILAIDYLEKALELADDSSSYVNTYKQMMLNDLISLSLLKEMPCSAKRCGGILLSLAENPIGKILPFAFFWGKLAMLKACLLEDNFSEAEVHFSAICAPSVCYPKDIDLGFILQVSSMGQTNLVLDFLRNYLLALSKDDQISVDDSNLSAGKKESLRILKMNRVLKYKALSVEVEKFMQKVQSGQSLSESDLPKG